MKQTATMKTMYSNKSLTGFSHSHSITNHFLTSVTVTQSLIGITHSDSSDLLALVTVTQLLTGYS